MPPDRPRETPPIDLPNVSAAPAVATHAPLPDKPGETASPALSAPDPASATDPAPAAVAAPPPEQPNETPSVTLPAPTPAVPVAATTPAADEPGTTGAIGPAASAAPGAAAWDEEPSSTGTVDPTVAGTDPPPASAPPAARRAHRSRAGALCGRRQGRGDAGAARSRPTAGRRCETGESETAAPQGGAGRPPAAWWTMIPRHHGGAWCDDRNTCRRGPRHNHNHMTPNGTGSSNTHRGKPAAGISSGNPTAASTDASEWQ